MKYLKDATPAGVLLGSGKLATELDRLDLIDEYRFLVHPRIAGHGPTLYQGGLPGTRRSNGSRPTPSATAPSPCTTAAPADPALQRPGQKMSWAKPTP